MNPKHPPTADPDPSEIAATALAEPNDGATKYGPPSAVQEAVEVQEQRWHSPSDVYDGAESQD